jgi:hypothetical protein
MSLPNPVDAYNHLFGDVHSRVFFGTLANTYGISPSTEKEASDLFEIAAQLRELPTPTQERNNGSRFQKAAGALNSVTRDSAAVEADSIKQAAAMLSQDPSIYASVLSLKLKEAELLNGNS